ncbi:hypothetical protein GF395_03895 [Candidatus Uhrbacteria bacterium]|nr:hypothetical protein [Candidatus Uhrbacteria bacterium]
MLYTPLPGTPLHEQMQEQGRMLTEEEIPIPEMHGQHRFNYRHPRIPPGMETEMLQRAFQHDYDENGPSLVRIIRTTLNGWKRYHRHPDLRVRKRFMEDGKQLFTTFPAIVWAAKQYGPGTDQANRHTQEVLQDLYRSLGLRARLIAELGGRYLLRTLRQEEKRLRDGWTYEPPTFYETNGLLFPSASYIQCAEPLPTE